MIRPLRAAARSRRSSFALGGACGGYHCHHWRPDEALGRGRRFGGTGKATDDLRASSRSAGSPSVRRISSAFPGLDRLVVVASVVLDCFLLLWLVCPAYTSWWKGWQLTAGVTR